MAALGVSCRGSVLVAVAAVMAAAVLGTASAANYNVGEPGGSWDLRTNYANWVSSQKFHPRDQIAARAMRLGHMSGAGARASTDKAQSASPSSIRPPAAGSVDWGRMSTLAARSGGGRSSRFPPSYPSQLGAARSGGGRSSRFPPSYPSQLGRRAGRSSRFPPSYPSQLGRRAGGTSGR